MIQIKNKKDCCGCGACFQVCPKQCISISEDKEGIIFPFVNTNLCIDCGLCEKVCPILNVKSYKLPESTYTLAAYNKVAQQRKESSSGGVFEAMARQTIGLGGVVFGAIFDKNWKVIHDEAKTLDQIEPLKYSKYVQSDTNDTFVRTKKYLKEGKQVLYVGTPCQIAGLKQFLRKPYENLISVDVVCHGVPSSGFWKKYLNKIQNDLSAQSAADGKNTILSSSLKSMPVITGINFRDKDGFGWQKYGFVVRGMSASKAGQNSVLLSNSHNDNLYMRAFLADMVLRDSCFHCQFRNGKSHSDITIADFWGIWNHCDNLEYAGDQGTSLIYAHNERAKKFISTLDINAIQMPFKTSYMANPAVMRDCPRPFMRRVFFKLLKYTTMENAVDISISIQKRISYTRKILRKIKAKIIKR